MKDTRKKEIRTNYKLDKAAAKSMKKASMAVAKGKIPNTPEAKERMYEKGLDNSRVVKKIVRQDSKVDRIGKSARATAISGAGANAGAKLPAKTGTAGKSGLAKSSVAPIRKAAAMSESRSNPKKGSLQLYGPGMSKSIQGRSVVSDPEIKAKIKAAEKETEGVWKSGADGSWKNDLIKKSK